MLLMLLVSLASANAKCDWSSLKLQQLNERNYYQWSLTGKVLDDTCVDYMFLLYNVQTKKVDTLQSFRGVCEYQINKKGKYKMYVKVWNNCLKCDTSMVRELTLIYFPKCNFTYNLKSTKNNGCLDSMVGEMGMGPVLKGDTCWQWYSYIWNGPMLDSLSDLDWDSTLMTDEQLTMYYDFNDSDMVWFKGPENAARLIKYKFPHDGHYLVATQWAGARPGAMRSSILSVCQRWCLLILFHRLIGKTTAMIPNREGQAQWRLVFSGRAGLGPSRGRWILRRSSGKGFARRITIHQWSPRRWLIVTMSSLCEKARALRFWVERTLTVTSIPRRPT